MDPKYGEFVGIEEIYIAKITKDDSSAYTPETPAEFVPTAEIASSVPISNVTTYYNNSMGETYTAEGPTDVKIVVSNADAKTLAEILGKDFVTADGLVFDDGAANPPDYALGFKLNMGKAGHRYYWYHKGTFSGGEEAAVTKKENVDVKTYELNYKAVTTDHKFTVNSKSKRLKRVYADTSDENFDPADWFTSVKVPAVV